MTRAARSIAFMTPVLAVLLAGSASAQWTEWLTVNPSTSGRVKSGDDFFASVVNDALDYSNVEDQRNSGFDDLDGPGKGTMSGGELSFTTGGPQPQLWLWYPGVRGAYGDEGTGARTPIDGDKYRVLTFKLTCTNCPTPAGGNFTGLNFFWLKGPAVSSYTTQTAFLPVHSGTNIYTIDLKSLTCGPDPTSANNAQIVSVKGALLNSTNPCTAADLWTGTIQGLRVGIGGPVNQSIQMSIDWVTLTTPNTATATLNWGTFNGSAKLRLLSDNGGVPGSTIRVQRTLCFDGASCSVAFTRHDLLASSNELPINVSQIPSVDVTFLSAGTYWIQALDASNQPITGTTPQILKVNSVPQVAFLQPDSRGDESSNYPLLYRNNADVWDFNLDSDFTVSFASDPLEYGLVQRLPNPQTNCGGGGNFGSNGGAGCLPAQLPGFWMQDDNSFATLDKGDSQFFPTLGGAPIDPTRFRHLTMRMLLDRPRDRAPGNTDPVPGDGNLGAVSRIIWYCNRLLAAGENNNLNVSEDIFIQNGVHELHVDLRRLRVDPNSTVNGRTPFERGGGPACGGPYLRYFRIDPHEYLTNTQAYYQLIMLNTNDKTVDGLFSFAWNRRGRDAFGVPDAGSSTTDADGDPVSITRIALDPDFCGRPANTAGGPADPDLGSQEGPFGTICPNPDNGNEITIATNPTNNGGFDFNAATVPSLPSGSYYARIEYTDGFNNVVRYSDAPMDVNPLPTTAQVPMFRLYSSAKDYHFFTSNPGARAFAISVGFRDESNPIPFNVFNTNVAATTALQRMYNPNVGVHFYTTGDVSFLRTLGALHEGSEGFIFPLDSQGGCSLGAGTTELFRLYNNNTGLHLYTANVQQKNGILTLFGGIWVQHASLGCVFP